MNKGITFLTLVILLSSFCFAVENRVTSFTSQSNPFNITFAANQDQSFNLNIPVYSYAKNISLVVNHYPQNVIYGFTSGTLDSNLFNVSYFNSGAGSGNGNWNITDNSVQLYAYDDTAAGSGQTFFIVKNYLNNTYMNLTLNVSTNWICGTSFPFNFIFYIMNNSVCIPSGATCEGARQLYNYGLASIHGVVNYTTFNILYYINTTSGNVSLYNNSLSNLLINASYNGMNNTYLGFRIQADTDDGVCTDSITAFVKNVSMVTQPKIKLYLNNNLLNDYNNSLNINSVNNQLSLLQPLNFTFHSDSAGVSQINLSNATYEFWLDNCTLGKNYSINYSIVDETSGNKIDTATTTGTYNYTIDGVNFYSYTLNSPLRNNYSICIYPNWTSITSYTTLYASAGTDYPQRRFYSTDTLTIAAQTKSLTLLNVSLGIYARFKTTDSYGNAISGVNAKMYKSTDLFNVIEEENSDGSGIATFFVNPNQDYYFIFTKSGYGTYTTVLRATTSEIYTIIMNGASSSSISYATGLSYYYTPTSFELEPNIIYNFTFNLTSSYWEITGCTFYLNKSDGTPIISSSSSFSTSRCGINITLNTSDYLPIIGYTIFELNHSVNITEPYIYWGEQNFTYSNFTIMTIFDDIDNLIGTSGFNAKTRLLLTFILIFAIVAMVSFKFQNTIITSQEGIIVLIWILVLLFSYIGWLTLGINPPNVTESYTSLIARQWLIFALTTMVSIGIIAYRRYS